jgi:hypothetical protein
MDVLQSSGRIERIEGRGVPAPSGTDHADVDPAVALEGPIDHGSATVRLEDVGRDAHRATPAATTIARACPSLVR